MSKKRFSVDIRHGETTSIYQVVDILGPEDSTGIVFSRAGSGPTETGELYLRATVIADILNEASDGLARYDGSHLELSERMYL